MVLALIAFACNRPSEPAPALRPQPTAAVDTGWWAPLPQATCPEPPEGAFVVEPVAGWVSMEWWDGNMIAYPNYLLMDFGLSNYGVPPCDADAGDGAFPDEQYPGRTIVDGRMWFIFDTLSQFVGVHELPQPADAALNIFNESIWLYTVNKDNTRTTARFTYGSAQKGGTAQLCIERLTPDVFEGTITFTDLDVTNPNPEAEQTWHFPLRFASHDSAWHKEHQVLPPCMFTHYDQAFKDLLWSGAWP